MSFFSKVKQFLGVGTISVDLQIPGQIAQDSGQVQGQVVLTAKSDQQVKSVELRFVEEYTTGRGDEKKTKEYELGKLTLGEAFAIKAEETRTIDFTLPFSMQLSSNQSLAQEKGVLGALGKAAVMARNERSEYFVRAQVKLEGAGLSPSDKKDIRLV
ncbi:MAG: sporulation protein [Chloroflexia bacterium]|nr:sporulation protein [Chloroflexia bacterium]